MPLAVGQALDGRDLGCRRPGRRARCTTSRSGRRGARCRRRSCWCRTRPACRPCRLALAGSGRAAAEVRPRPALLAVDVTGRCGPCDAPLLDAEQGEESRCSEPTTCRASAEGGSRGRVTGCPPTTSPVAWKVSARRSSPRCPRSPLRDRRGQPRPGLPRHRRAARGRRGGDRRHPRRPQPVPARAGHPGAAAGGRRRTSSASTGSTVDPDTEVLVTTGATEAVAAALLGLVDPGDEVVALEPFYDSYAACIAMAGGVRRAGHPARAGLPARRRPAARRRHRRAPG